MRRRRRSARRPAAGQQTRRQARLLKVVLSAVGPPRVGGATVSRLWSAFGGWELRGAPCSMQQPMLWFAGNALAALVSVAWLMRALCAPACSAACRTPVALLLVVADEASAMEAEGGAAEAEEAANDATGVPKPTEPSSYELSNPSRVVPAQEQFISLDPEGRWAPVHQGAKAGILVLKDKRPGVRRSFASLFDDLFARPTCGSTLLGAWLPVLQLCVPGLRFGWTCCHGRRRARRFGEQHWALVGGAGGGSGTRSAVGTGRCSSGA
jgi:26S proteasome regulatory subunit RPN2 C-terminal domain